MSKENKNNKKSMIIVIILLVIMVITVIILGILNNNKTQEAFGTNAITSTPIVDAIPTEIPTTTPEVTPVIENKEPVNNDNNDTTDENIINDIPVAPEEDLDYNKEVENNTDFVEPTVTPEDSIPEVTTTPEVTKIPDEVKPTVEPTKIPENTPEPTKVPETTKIPEVTTTPEPTKVPENTPTPKPETTKTTTIGGVKVPVVNGFVSANNGSNGLFANDNDEVHPYYDATKEFSKYIYDSMVKLGETVTEGISYVKYIDNSISISPFGNHSMEQSMSLYKNEDNNQYELVLKSRLKDNTYAEINKNSLKLLIAAFTNDISNLYTIIYDSMETDNTHGLNESTWTSFNNYKIKVDLSTTGQVTYFIKSK